MKKIVIIAFIGINLFSCKNEKKNEDKAEQKIETSKSEISSKEVNWDETPELKDIGNFPFITAPTGLVIYKEKNGMSEFFEYETMENYTGSSVYSTEGKLGILQFTGIGEEDFSQKLFDKSVYDYIDKMGAKKLYKGDFPTNEEENKKVGENMWSGKNGTSGLIKENNTPFSVYVFKNSGKKYILNIQSNSAQGNVFIMELKDFVQTIKKYSAVEMQTEIEKTGKAILNINFDTDKATIKPDGQPIIVEIVSLLNTNPSINLSIEGHTDNVGIPERNKQLSIDRANSVMEALINNKINKSRLKATGFGSEKSLAPNDTEENKGKNRRVELVKY
jgi:OmpA-OmpF porin, OOP family